MSTRDEERKKKEKKQKAWLEQQIMMIMQKSLKAALDKAVDDLLKDFH